MKYIITGKNISKGVIGDDSGSFEIYTELGWEVMVNRLRLIDLLQNKKVSKDDIIVTCQDRIFLYSKIFKNVIDFNSFKKLNIDNENILDLTKDMEAYIRTMIWTPQYNFLKRDLDIILEIDTNFCCDLDIKKPFVCILARFRSWCSDRNTNVEYLNNLIAFLKEQKIDVFVLGMQAKEILNNEFPIYINLQEFCFLMQHPLCRFVYGKMSGPMHLAKFCCKSILIIDDDHGFRKQLDLENHPLFFGLSSNFTGIPIIFYSSPPQIIDFLKYL
jgi:hypothetical protein